MPRRKKPLMIEYAKVARELARTKEAFAKLTVSAKSVYAKKADATRLVDGVGAALDAYTDYFEELLEGDYPDCPYDLMFYGSPERAADIYDKVYSEWETEATRND